MRFETKHGYFYEAVHKTAQKGKIWHRQRQGLPVGKNGVIYRAELTHIWICYRLPVGKVEDRGEFT